MERLRPPGIGRQGNGAAGRRPRDAAAFTSASVDGAPFDLRLSVEGDNEPRRSRHGADRVDGIRRPGHANAVARDPVQARDADPEYAVRPGHGRDQQGIAARPERRATGADQARRATDDGYEVVPVVTPKGAGEQEVSAIGAPLDEVDRCRTFDESTACPTTEVRELDAVPAAGSAAGGHGVRELLPIGGDGRISDVPGRGDLSPVAERGRYVAGGTSQHECRDAAKDHDAAPRRDPHGLALPPYGRRLDRPRLSRRHPTAW